MRVLVKCQPQDHLEYVMENEVLFLNWRVKTCPRCGQLVVAMPAQKSNGVRFWIVTAREQGKERAHV